MEKRGLEVIFTICIILIASVRTTAEECTDAMNHPEWLWCDDFETSSTASYDGGWRQYVTYVTDHNLVFSGQRSIQATITPGVNSAAGIYKYFQGQDGPVYARWYAKFDVAYDDQGHQHFVSLQGLDTSKACGCAGCCANSRPSGDDRFLSGLEFDDTGTALEPRLYSYFYNQRNPSSAYRCCPKPLSQWAQGYKPSPAQSIDKGTWHAMELMIKPNTPGSDDGYQAFWIDGRLVMNVSESREQCGPYTSSTTDECEQDDASVDVHPNFYANPPPYAEAYPAEGFVWRTASSLKLNNVWIQVYNHEADTNPGVNKVWFDNLVVSKEYVGPLPCANAKQITSACYCGGSPSESASGNVHAEGYCCNGTWGSSTCAEINITFNYCHEADNAPQDASISSNELKTFIEEWDMGHKSSAALLDVIAKWKNNCQ